MLWIYRFICGFLTVEVSGDIAENILNICAKNGIPLWGIKRTGKKLCCRMTIKSFKLLPKVRKNSGIRIHILKKYGIPFIAARYKKRYGIIAGAAIFFGLLKLMSLFVWSIEVEGNKTVSASEITAACEEIGVYEGMNKKDLDPKNAGQSLLLKCGRLAWASFNLEGCRLTVNVTEAKPKAEDNSIPTNLKAAADGIITKIYVTSGNCVVKVGDSVAKGDLLVSGIIENENGTRFVHSIGKIEAVTEREIILDGSFEKKETVKTGEKKKKSALYFFTFKIPLYLGKVSGGYESRTEVKSVKLFNKSLPIRLYTKTFEITEDRTVRLSREQLENELLKRYNEYAKVENISGFEVKNREFDEIEGGIRLKMVICGTENIAGQDVMLFNTGN